MRWVDVERRSDVGRDLFYAAVVIVFAWTMVWAGTSWLWPVAVVGTVGVLAFTGWSVLYRKPTGTVLVGDVLVERHQSRDTHIPVSDIVAIEYAWVPYAGGSMIVRSRSGATAHLQLGSPDRIELGRMLRQRQPMLSFSPRIERELGYYD